MIWDYCGLCAGDGLGSDWVDVKFRYNEWRREKVSRSRKSEIGIISKSQIHHYCCGLCAVFAKVDAPSVTYATRNILGGDDQINPEEL